MGAEVGTKPGSAGPAAVQSFLVSSQLGVYEPGREGVFSKAIRKAETQAEFPTEKPEPLLTLSVFHLLWQHRSYLVNSCGTTWGSGSRSRAATPGSGAHSLCVSVNFCCVTTIPALSAPTAAATSS